jgi:hypothetical protein
MKHILCFILMGRVRSIGRLTDNRVAFNAGRDHKVCHQWDGYDVGVISN